MNAVPFDTLKLARDLEAAGLAPPVAAGASAALADALIGADLVTKSDLVGLESRMEARMDARMAGMDSRMLGMDSRISAMEARLIGMLELLRRDMIIKLGGMMFVAVGVILTAMRLMPHP